MLTQKQERFTLNIFKGMSQREAYIQAGYSSNQLPDTLDRHAFDLANNGKILARLDELNEPLKDEAIADKEEVMREITSVVRHPIEKPVSAGAKVAAGRELSLMRGDYAPQKSLVAKRVQFEVVYTKHKQLSEESTREVIEGETNVTKQEEG